MDEMLRKEDVLKALSAKIDELEKRDAKADVILGLATAMSVVKLMEGEPAEKQEPCADAISRQAVLDLAKFDGRDGLGSIIHAFDVEQLPPVNPAEKVGRWEWVQYDSNPNIGNWHCSECRAIIPHMPENVDNTPIYKWCPYCGAKMQEVKNDR